jgi:nucleoside-diphosphate kinase
VSRRGGTVPALRGRADSAATVRLWCGGFALDHSGIGTVATGQEEQVLIQRTLVLVKPDGVRRGLIGDVLARIERKGLQIVAMDLRTIDAELAEAHYAEHIGKPFYGPLVEFVTSGPLVALVVQGPRAIEAFRGLAGATDPVQAAAGTIRGDHALDVQQNVVHGSDSPDSAEREIKIFFPDLV